MSTTCITLLMSSLALLLVSALTDLDIILITSALPQTWEQHAKQKRTSTFEHTNQTSLSIKNIDLLSWTSHMIYRRAILTRSGKLIKFLGFLFTSISRLSVVDDKMINEHGAIGRMKIGKRNPSILRKPAPLALRPPEIPHYLVRYIIRAVVMEDRILTVEFMASPLSPN